MKRIITATGFIVLSALIIASCGKGAKDKKAEVNDMKVKLEKLKKEKTQIETEIRKIETDIAKADPKSAQGVQKLVIADTVRIQDFSHYIELQGKIGSDGVAYVSPTGQGGQVRAIYVKTGQKVSKGQVVAKLDDAVARQAVSAAQQQTGVLKARLAQAETVYERYQNLWKQNIGAEIQVINAKADVDALSAQLRAAQANVAQAQEVVNMTNVRAGISGTVEQVNVRVGEYFSGVTPDGRSAQILIVNSSSIKVEVPVPDSYVAKVKKGDKVLVSVPETGKAPYETTISTVGGAIDPVTRSFMAEAKLPSDPLLKPNQTATIKILDYQSKAAITVPVNIVQSDEKSKYVYVMEKSGDKMVARKKVVLVGEVYNGQIEIKSGLTGGEVIIIEGYQGVYDGQGVTTGK
jgi:membrane fusion protein (multidrug efflux system)